MLFEAWPYQQVGHCWISIISPHPPFILQVYNFRVGRNINLKCICQIQSLILGIIWSILWLFMWKDINLTPQRKSLILNPQIVDEMTRYELTRDLRAKTWKEKKKVYGEKDNGLYINFDNIILLFCFIFGLLCDIILSYNENNG